MVGGTAWVRVGFPKSLPAKTPGAVSTPFGNVQPELSGPPEGIVIRNFLPTREGMEIMLQSDVAKVKPGQKGNLIVKIFGEKTEPPEKDMPQMNKQRVLLGTLPAIPFEIVER
jgi:hypothetical protein